MQAGQNKTCLARVLKSLNKTYLKLILSVIPAFPLSDYDNGKLANIYLLDNDTLKYKWNYSYPIKGKIIETDFNVQNNKSAGVTYYDVDGNGLILKQVNKNEKDEQVGISNLYERDNNGMITDKKTFNPDGKINSHFDVWNYDNKNKLFKVHRSTLNGESADSYGVTRTYEYDDKGNWIKQTRINPDKNNIRVTVRKFVYY